MFYVLSIFTDFQCITASSFLGFFFRKKMTPLKPRYDSLDSFKEDLYRYELLDLFYFKLLTVFYPLFVEMGKNTDFVNTMKDHIIWCVCSAIYQVYFGILKRTWKKIVLMLFLCATTEINCFPYWSNVIV